MNAGGQKRSKIERPQKTSISPQALEFPLPKPNLKPSRHPRARLALCQPNNLPVGPLNHHRVLTMAETKTSVIATIEHEDAELMKLDRMASAVALPEDSSEQSPTTNGLKRRQSEASEQDNKRQRTSPGKSSPTIAPKDEGGEGQAQADDNSVKPTQKAGDAREARRKSGVTDEKQRSKRLFGALLGNLNQPGDRVSRRRSEIEQRRKAELQKQDDERLEDRQKRLEKLAAQRKREQINVDEQNVRDSCMRMAGRTNG